MGRDAGISEASLIVELWMPGLGRQQDSLDEGLIGHAGMSNRFGKYSPSAKKQLCFVR